MLSSFVLVFLLSHRFVFVCLYWFVFGIFPFTLVLLLFDFFLFKFPSLLQVFPYLLYYLGTTIISFGKHLSLWLFPWIIFFHFSPSSSYKPFLFLLSNYFFFRKYIFYACCSNSYMNYFICAILPIFLPSLFYRSQSTGLMIFFSSLFNFVKSLIRLFLPLRAYFFFFIIFTKFNYINDVDFNSSSFFLI